MSELLCLAPTLILGFLLWQEKRDNRAERATLLNRIQAPELELHKLADPVEIERIPYDAGFHSEPEDE